MTMKKAFVYSVTAKSENFTGRLAETKRLKKGFRMQAGDRPECRRRDSLPLRQAHLLSRPALPSFETTETTMRMR